MREPPSPPVSPPSWLSRAMERLLFGMALAWIVVVMVFYFTVGIGPSAWGSPADASILVIFAVVALTPIVTLFATRRVLRRIVDRSRRAPAPR